MASLINCFKKDEYYFLDDTVLCFWVKTWCLPCKIVNNFTLLWSLLLEKGERTNLDYYRFCHFTCVWLVSVVLYFRDSLDCKTLGIQT